MALSHNRITPFGITKPKEKSQNCKLTLKECLTLLIGGTIPVLIAIYTAVTNEQMQKSAKFVADEQQRIASERRVFDLQQVAELYQQQLYKNFLNDIYTLHKDGKLNISANPWVFANARYRTAHRIWDASQKAEVLQFLKEKQLIGRQKCATGCEIKNVDDIIRLHGLDFDHVNISSQIATLNQVDLSCIEFDKVSMINAIFSYVNLNGVLFVNSRLNGVQFNHVSLKCATFNGTELDGADFGESDLGGAQFINVNLSTAKFRLNQTHQATFENVIMPNGITYTSKRTTTPKTTDRSETTPSNTLSPESIKTTSPVFHSVSVSSSPPTTTGIPSTCPNTNWTQNGFIIAGGNEYGSALNQLFRPCGLYVDDNQSVLIADNHNDRIVEWKFGATSDELLAGGNGQGKRIDQLNEPTDVVLDKRTDTLFICDHGNERVMRWSRQSRKSEGTVIDKVACEGLAIDEQGFIYVPDRKKHEVRRYQIGDPNGILVAGSNGQGDRLNQLSSPGRIFVDQNHSVYVSDIDNHRVMKWVKGAREGIAMDITEGGGHSSSQGREALGIFVDSVGTLYRAEFSKVWRVCNSAMKGNTVVGGWFPNQADSLEGAKDLTFDRHGNLYVVDMANNRVQRFSIEVS